MSVGDASACQTQADAGPGHDRGMAYLTGGEYALIGVALGAVLTGVGEAAREWRNRVFQRRERTVTRQDERNDRATRFELENLAQIGPLLDSFMTTATRLFDMRAQSAHEHDGQIVGSPNEPTSDARKSRDDWQMLDRLAPLVLDDDVRAAITEAVRAIAALSVYSGSISGGHESQTKAHDDLKAAQEATGSRARTLYCPATP